MRVDRYLKDKAMDRIHHALGRPVDPMGETYRKYFAADADGPVAAQMAASPHWRGGRVSDGLHWFYVTDAGRAALRDHLREIGDKHRLYAVTFDGITSTCVATSHAKARYSKWLDWSECRDITFKDFCRSARVRLA